MPSAEAVHNVMTNTLLPPDSKGVMVALRPAPGLRVEQALTLCKPNRMGDIMTIGNNRRCCFCRFADRWPRYRAKPHFPAADRRIFLTVWCRLRTSKSSRKS